jgi:hypothetical protein
MNHVFMTDCWQCEVGCTPADSYGSGCWCSVADRLVAKDSLEEGDNLYPMPDWCPLMLKQQVDGKGAKVRFE